MIHLRKIFFNMKRLYLDVCTFYRPFDDQNIMRNHLEATAFFLILQNIYLKKYKMIISPVHEIEVQSIDEINERQELMEIFAQYGEKPECNLNEIRKRAEELVKKKFGPADAAHFAFAETASDFFITCDDRLLNLCQDLESNIIALNPVEFCIKEKLK